MYLITRLRALRAVTAKDEGQDLLEYALLVALIAVICVVAVGATGTNVNAIFERIRDELATALS
jgi:Flp pilus assembly pilin Flp